jgi:hypothetical protein
MTTIHVGNLVFINDSDRLHSGAHLGSDKNLQAKMIHLCLKLFSQSEFFDPVAQRNKEGRDISKNTTDVTTIDALIKRL